MKFQRETRVFEIEIIHMIFSLIIKKYIHFIITNTFILRFCYKTKMAANIFNQHNQFIIRFPESIADRVHEYFDNGDQEIQISLQQDPHPQKKSSRISLITTIDEKQYKASVIELPTISSTFKTLDRYNYFKSNDISEMIYVHEDEYDVINESEAERIAKREGN